MSERLTTERTRRGAAALATVLAVTALAACSDSKVGASPNSAGTPSATPSAFETPTPSETPSQTPSETPSKPSTTPSKASRTPIDMDPGATLRHTLADRIDSCETNGFSKDRNTLELGLSVVGNEASIDTREAQSNRNRAEFGAKWTNPNVVSFILKRNVALTPATLRKPFSSHVEPTDVDPGNTPVVVPVKPAKNQEIAVFVKTTASTNGLDGTVRTTEDLELCDTFHYEGNQRWSEMDEAPATVQEHYTLNSSRPQ